MGIDAIIISAGPSGITMAYKLKHELGFEDFTIYNKLDSVSSTWRSNTYLGWYVLMLQPPSKMPDIV
jgi:cation diffusion facilitator CzcD-associated flavoprotein CzcO